MTSPVSAAWYADRAIQRPVQVVENVPLARDTYRIRLDCPELARRIVPGQFLMLKLAGLDDPLLGRPLALYDTVVSPTGEPTGIDVVYLVTGKMTRRLADYGPGQLLDAWGPLGNGFAPQSTEHLIMVAGGIGQTPFMALGREYLGLRRYGAPPRAVPNSAKVTLCYGARRAEYLAGVDEFRALGVDVQLSTDDGSAGHHGLVTDLLREVLEQGRARLPPSRNAPPQRGEGEAPAEPCRVVCCGPEKMMEAVAHITAQANVACQVSLETPMACGIGICFSCVTKVRQSDGEWDYRRTCVEGPVFEAEQIVW
jgi:dihydroorotate dehydrogenase electron transfer subunit